MATANERLTESLRVLKEYQEKNDFTVIHYNNFRHFQNFSLNHFVLSQICYIFVP